MGRQRSTYASTQAGITAGEWSLFYQDERPDHLLVGQGPVLFSRESGELVEFGSATAEREAVIKYESLIGERDDWRLVITGFPRSQAHLRRVLQQVGDTHAAWHRLYDGVHLAFREHDIQIAIQVGDFGFFKKYEPFPLGHGYHFRLTVLLHVIDGNHEDHKWLRNRIDDGTSRRWADEQNIVFQQRGSTVLFNGFCGGSLHADLHREGSIDRGTTNWLTNREAERAADAFIREMVDLIVTHSCPHSIGVGMAGNPYLAEMLSGTLLEKSMMMVQ